MAWFDEPWLVSQHLVDGEEVEDLGGDILQPLQPLRVTVVLKKFSFKNRYLHARTMYIMYLNCDYWVKKKLVNVHSPLYCHNVPLNYACYVHVDALVT